MCATVDCRGTVFRFPFLAEQIFTNDVFSSIPAFPFFPASSGANHPKKTHLYLISPN